MGAKVSEDHVGRKIVAHELLHGLGEQDLSSMPCRQQPGQPIQGGGEVVTIQWRCFTDMQRHPDLQRTRRIKPWLILECALRGETGSKRRGGRRECRLRTITDRLVEHTPVSLDRGTEEEEVPL